LTDVNRFIENIQYMIFPEKRLHSRKFADEMIARGGSSDSDRYSKKRRRGQVSVFRLC